MKKIIYFILFALISTGIFAQEIQLKGIVTSADDRQPLPGVSVVVVGTTKGTVTNFDGEYQLNVAGDAILQFSFIGMESQEIAVNGRSEINVEMLTETTGLDEVVVIGYGTVKRKDVTGAVSMVSSETIENIKPVKVEQALQGTMAGVNVTAQSGAPGA
ncbi:MAG: carboxypeptidase-like regulatory domain-containing protein, partial [Prolixibacteraceae bacterium]|nr:carboxypeptidase-like regulatory domain-containing protein [Prolixibacteraceae bacterium]